MRSSAVDLVGGIVLSGQWVLWFWQDMVVEQCKGELSFRKTGFEVVLREDGKCVDANKSSVGDRVSQKGGDGDNTMHGIRRVEEDNSGVGDEDNIIGRVWL